MVLRCIILNSVILLIIYWEVSQVRCLCLRVNALAQFSNRASNLLITTPNIRVLIVWSSILNTALFDFYLDIFLLHTALNRRNSISGLRAFSCIYRGCSLNQIKLRIPLQIFRLSSITSLNSVSLRDFIVLWFLNRR